MGGGAFHPRRKRQSRGRGGWGGLHSGPRPQTWVASGWTGEGCRQGTQHLGSALVTAVGKQWIGHQEASLDLPLSPFPCRARKGIKKTRER